MTSPFVCLSIERLLILSSLLHFFSYMMDVVLDNHLYPPLYTILSIIVHVSPRSSHSVVLRFISYHFIILCSFIFCRHPLIFPHLSVIPLFIVILPSSASFYRLYRHPPFYSSPTNILLFILILASFSLLSLSYHHRSLLSLS